MACTDSGSEAPDRRTLTVAVSDLGNEVWAPWLASGNADPMMEMIMEPLTRFDKESRELVPGLAESWTLSSDLLTWTFKLRADVPFQDDYGTVTAEDVKYSWAQLIREDSTNARSNVLRKAVGGDIENFEIVNPLEFKIHSPQPMVTLPSNLAAGLVTLRVTSKKYWETVGEEAASKHPLGTGPFKFVSHTRGVEVRLESVKNHWRQSPGFDQLVLKIVTDPAARLAQVQTGAADLAPLPLTMTAEAAGLKVFSIPNVALANVFFGGMYPLEPQYNDPDAPWIQQNDPAKGRAVREAMSLAIDREAIVKDLLFGQGTTAAAPIVYFPGAPSTDPAWQVPAYDPARARQLLAEGGYPNGFSLEMPIFATPQGAGFDTDVAEAVASSFEAIGITVTREPMDFPAWRALAAERGFGGKVYQFSVPYYTEVLDAIQVPYMPGAAVPHFFDPAISDAVGRLSKEPSAAARVEIAKELGAKLIEDRRAIPIASVNAIYVASNSVADWQFRPGVGRPHNFEYLSFA